MRLIPSQSPVIEFRGRHPARAPLWVGLAVLGGPFLLSLLGPAPFTSFHVTGLALLFMVAALLLTVGRPAARWVRLDLQQRSVTSNDQGSARLPEEPLLRLVSVWTRGSSGNARYGVAVDREGAEPLVLLACDEPAAALSDLRALRERGTFHVADGWGLPGDAPWIDRPRPDSEAPRRDAPWDDRAVRRPLVRMLAIATTAIGLMMALEIHGRIALGDTVASFSVALPLATLSVLGLLTLAVATHRFELSLGTELVSEQRLFGVAYARRAIPRAKIRGAYLVSPSGHHARHLLVDTEDGPLAFPCDDALGERIAGQLAPRARAAA